MSKAIDVDALANEIRRVDGNHSLGAGALAEALMSFLVKSMATPERIDEAARHLRETLQAGKNLKPWSITEKATKKKWLALAKGTIEAAFGRIET